MNSTYFCCCMFRPLLLFFACSYCLYAVSVFLLLLAQPSVSGTEVFPFALMAGSACLPMLFYLFRSYRISQKASPDADVRMQWYKKHLSLVQALLFVLAAFALLAFLMFLLQRPEQSQLVGVACKFLLAGLLTRLYYPNPIVKKGLRSKGMLKPICLSFTWTLLCILPLPGNHAPLSFFSSLLHPQVFSLFFLFCGIAILSDVKDAENDAQHQVRTLPVILGPSNSILFFVVPLFLLSALFDFGIFPQAHTLQGMALSLVGFMLCLFVSLQAIKQRDLLFFLCAVDGLMLVKAVLWICLF